ncbi:hypothetical protein D3C71_2055600 [compost metagenome]
MIGTQGKHIERLEITAGICHLAEKIHLPGDTQLCRQRLELAFQSALAQHRQACAGR